MIVKAFDTGPIEVNCYVVTDEETRESFMVDPGGSNAELTAYLRKEQLNIKFILLTHGHADHIGGVKAYANLCNAPVYAHIDEKPVLTNPTENFSREVLGSHYRCEVDHYLHSEEQLMIGDKPIRIIHTPGHSPGGICILVDGILFSGDTLFSRSVGRSDFPHSSTKALFESINNHLSVLDDCVIVYPGHGPSTTIGEEKNFNPFL